MTPLAAGLSACDVYYTWYDSFSNPSPSRIGKTTGTVASASTSYTPPGTSVVSVTAGPGLFVTSAGDVYYWDNGAGGIMKKPNGGSAVALALPLVGYWTGPGGIWVTAGGDIYVADQDSVFKYSSSVNPTLVSPQVWKAGGDPYSVAVFSGTNADVIVAAGPNTNTVKRYDYTGSLVATLGGSWTKPVGVTISAAGDVYIADSGTVTKFVGGAGSAVDNVFSPEPLPS